MATFFHISPTVNRTSIQKRGLIPSRSKQEFAYLEHPVGIYVFKSEKDAINWAFDTWSNYSNAERGLDLWKVQLDPKSLKVDTHPEAEGAWYTTKPIPPSAVKLESYLDESLGELPPSDEDGHLEEDDIEYLD